MDSTQATSWFAKRRAERDGGRQAWNPDRIESLDSTRPIRSLKPQSGRRIPVQAAGLIDYSWLQDIRAQVPVVVFHAPARGQGGG